MFATLRMASRTQRWLIQAGYCDSHHLTIYMGSRLACAFMGLLAGLATSGLDSPVLLVGMTGLGFFLPRFALKHKIQNRQQRIKLGLPDALDLIVICIEAGLSLEESLARVSKDLRHTHLDLSDELYLVSREMRAAQSIHSWDEALSNLSLRTGVGDIKTLVGVLIEAGPLGIVGVLHAYSDSLRMECQHRAKAKVIQMVPLLLLFVIPLLLVVTLGPGFIQLIRTFKPVMGH